MSDHNLKQAKRLVSFRKMQRDRASLEAASARRIVEKALDEVSTQEKRVADESDNLPANRGETVRPEDASLDLACIEAERSDLSLKRAALRSAEQTLGQKAGMLLAAHNKVRQMEALETAAKIAQKQVAKKKETKEIDDLAINKEARKP